MDTSSGLHKPLLKNKNLYLKLIEKIKQIRIRHKLTSQVEEIQSRLLPCERIASKISGWVGIKGKLLTIDDLKY